MWTALPWRRGRPFVCCGGCKLRVLSQSLRKRGASSLGRESLPVPEHVCSCAACSCCNKKSDQKAPSGGKHFLLPPEALCARVDDPSTRESGLTTAYESNLQITNEHPSYHRTLVCLLLVQWRPNQEPFRFIRQPRWRSSAASAPSPPGAPHTPSLPPGSSSMPERWQGRR